MNKIIAFLLLITPCFTYGMQELALVCTMKKEKRQCTNAFFSEKSFSIQDFKGQEERPENIEESQSYHIFFKKIDETRKPTPTPIPQFKAPALRGKTGWSRQIFSLGNQSTVQNSKSSISISRGRNFHVSASLEFREEANAKKRLNESAISCYSPKLKEELATFTKKLKKYRF